eukprot:6399993-Amphidinium_carterae.1
MRQSESKPEALRGDSMQWHAWFPSLIHGFIFFEAKSESQPEALRGDSIWNGMAENNTKNQKFRN